MIIQDCIAQNKKSERIWMGDIASLTTKFYSAKDLDYVIIYTQIYYSKSRWFLSRDAIYQKLKKILIQYWINIASTLPEVISPILAQWILSVIVIHQCDNKIWMSNTIASFDLDYVHCAYPDIFSKSRCYGNN